MNARPPAHLPVPPHPSAYLSASQAALDDARRCEHLAHLLHTVGTYLPRHLVRTELAATDTEPARPRGEFLNGALAFADISGFTAMSERLGALGREGAEQITEVVNRYFRRMLDIIFEHGGDVFKFGGDALLAYYPDGEQPGVVAALTASWRMQQAMSEFAEVKTSLGGFPLRMKIGLNAGSIFTARVGSPHDRHFLVSGGPVNATARAESLSFAGEILLTPAARAQLGPDNWQFQFIPGPEGHHLLDQVNGDLPVLHRAPPAAPPPATLDRLVAALDRITPYLPHGLLPRLVADPAQPLSSGEHRLVGVLFANYLGADTLIEHLGPDHPHEIAAHLDRYIVAIQAAVGKYGGVINKIDLYDHGDKVMALFGAPSAHEDDTERTLRAALDMQAVEHNAPPMKIQQAIGLNAGVVFAGDVGSDERREYTVMGDDVNLAARLMAAAQPGELLLSNAVRRKVAALFDVADRGAVKVKGKTQPVPIFSINGPRAQPEPVRGIRGLYSPLVGRAAEAQTVTQVAAEVRSGRGRILKLIGEAGLGKSRLLADLHESLIAGECVCYESHCLSYTQSVSYSAFNDLVRAMLGLALGDSEAIVWSKLRHRLAEVLAPDAADDILPYLANFLSLPLPAALAERVTYLEGEALQRQVIRAVSTLIEQLARQHPLILIFDDLHWADSASLVMLERVLNLVEHAPLLIALLYRPDRAQGSWALGELAARTYPQHCVEVTLHPLNVAAGEDQLLVQNLLSMETVPPALVQLIGRAEGNPFYIEELIRVLIEVKAIVPRRDRWTMTTEIETIAVPDSLQGIIMARLDRLLEESRRTVQVASVVGRTFRYLVLNWLAQAATLATQLDTSLTELQRAELVRELSRVPEVEYGFAQAMFRDVAYESLLLRDRRTYHRLVGQQLEDSYPDDQREEVYELLAHHYSLSDNRYKALYYLIKAADKTRLAYANTESINFYRQAALLADRIGTPDDNASVAEGLGDVLYHVGEYDDALACFERALAFRAEPRQRADLYRRTGAVHEKRGAYEAARQACATGLQLLTPDHMQTVEMARLLTLECRVHHQQGQFEKAIEDGEQALAIVEDSAHYREVAQAHNELGNACDQSGQSERAIFHFERGLIILERIGDEHGAATIYNNLGFIYYQTDTSRALDYVHRYLMTMQRVGDFWAEATAYQNLGVVHYARGEYEAAIEWYQHSLSMKTRVGDNLGIADCNINLGEAYRGWGQPERALDHLQRGLSLARQIGAESAITECYRQLAECYLELRQPEQALNIGQQALTHAQEIGNRLEEGIARRVLGTVYAQQHDVPAAQENFEASLHIFTDLNRDFDLATTRGRYGAMLLAADQPAQARPQLEAALALFEQMNLPADVNRIRDLLARTG